MELKIEIDNEFMQNAVDKAVEKIKKSADFVIVTRCKDCKFYLPQENGIGVCGIHDYGTEPNDFCSFAEQREGERE